MPASAPPALTPPADLYHALSWPQLSYVAEDHKGRVVGYILAKMCVSDIFFTGCSGLCAMRW